MLRQRYAYEEALEPLLGPLDDQSASNERASPEDAPSLSSSSSSSSTSSTSSPTNPTSVSSSNLDSAASNLRNLVITTAAHHSPYRLLHTDKHVKSSVPAAEELKRLVANFGLQLACTKDRTPTFHHTDATPFLLRPFRRLYPALAVHELSRISPEVFTKVEVKFEKILHRLSGDEMKEWRECVAEWLEEVRFKSLPPPQEAVLAAMLAHVAGLWNSHAMERSKQSSPSVPQKILVRMNNQIFFPLLRDVCSIDRTFCAQVVNGLMELTRGNELPIPSPSLQREKEKWYTPLKDWLLEVCALPPIISYESKEGEQGAMVEESESEEAKALRQTIQSKAAEVLLHLNAASNSLSEVLSVLHAWLTDRRFGGTDLMINVGSIFERWRRDMPAGYCLSPKTTRFQELAAPILQKDTRHAWTFDGSFLYTCCAGNLLKLGTGYNGTILSHVYAQCQLDLMSKQNPSLAYADGRLFIYFVSSDDGVARIVIMNTDDFSELGHMLVNGSGTLPSKDNSAWGLGDGGQLTGDGQYLYHVHYVPPPVVDVREPEPVVPMDTPDNTKPEDSRAEASVGPEATPERLATPPTPEIVQIPPSPPSLSSFFEPADFVWPSATVTDWGSFSFPTSSSSVPSTSSSSREEPAPKVPKFNCVVDVYDPALGLEHIRRVDLKEWAEQSKAQKKARKPIFPKAVVSATGKQDFKPYTGTDGSSLTQVEYHVITAMPQYSHLSFEELQWAAICEKKHSKRLEHVEEEMLKRAHCYVDGETLIVLLTDMCDQTRRFLYRTFDIENGVLISESIIDRPAASPTQLDMSGGELLCQPELMLQLLHIEHPFKSANKPVPLEVALLVVFGILDRLSFDRIVKEATDVDRVHDITRSLSKKAVEIFYKLIKAQVDSLLGIEKDVTLATTADKAKERKRAAKQKKKEQQKREDETPPEVACIACTYLNPYANDACEMCETPLVKETRQEIIEDEPETAADDDMAIAELFEDSLSQSSDGNRTFGQISVLAGLKGWKRLYLLLATLRIFKVSVMHQIQQGKVLPELALRGAIRPVLLVQFLRLLYRLIEAGPPASLSKRELRIWEVISKYACELLSLLIVETPLSMRWHLVYDLLSHQLSIGAMRPSNADKAQAQGCENLLLNTLLVWHLHKQDSTIDDFFFSESLIDKPKLDLRKPLRPQLVEQQGKQKEGETKDKGKEVDNIASDEMTTRAEEESQMQVQAQESHTSDSDGSTSDRPVESAGQLLMTKIMQALDFEVNTVLAQVTVVPEGFPLLPTKDEEPLVRVMNIFHQQAIRKIRRMKRQCKMFRPIEKKFSRPDRFYNPLVERFVHEHLACLITKAKGDLSTLSLQLTQSELKHLLSNVERLQRLVERSYAGRLSSFLQLLLEARMIVPLLLNDLESLLRECYTLPIFDKQWAEAGSIVEELAFSVCKQMGANLESQLITRPDMTVPEWLDSELFAGGMQELPEARLPDEQSRDKHLAELAAQRFLDSFIEGIDGRQEVPAKSAEELAQRQAVMREAHELASWMAQQVTRKKPLGSMGGEEVDRLERTVIAAMLKHNGLTSDAFTYGHYLVTTQTRRAGDIPPTLQAIWETAYNVRVWIIQQRQESTGAGGEEGRKDLTNRLEMRLVFLNKVLAPAKPDRLALPSFIKEPQPISATRIRAQLDSWRQFTSSFALSGEPTNKRPTPSKAKQQEESDVKASAVPQRASSPPPSPISRKRKKTARVARFSSALSRSVSVDSFTAHRRAKVLHKAHNQKELKFIFKKWKVFRERVIRASGPKDEQALNRLIVAFIMDENADAVQLLGGMKARRDAAMTRRKGIEMFSSLLETMTYPVHEILFVHLLNGLQSFTADLRKEQSPNLSLALLERDVKGCGFDELERMSQSFEKLTSTVIATLRDAVAQLKKDVQGIGSTKQSEGLVNTVLHSLSVICLIFNCNDKVLLSKVDQVLDAIFDLRRQAKAATASKQLFESASAAVYFIALVGTKALQLEGYEQEDDWQSMLGKQVRQIYEAIFKEIFAHFDAYLNWRVTIRHPAPKAISTSDETAESSGSSKPEIQLPTPMETGTSETIAPSKESISTSATADKEPVLPADWPNARDSLQPSNIAELQEHEREVSAALSLMVSLTKAASGGKMTRIFTEMFSGGGSQSLGTLLSLLKLGTVRMQYSALRVLQYLLPLVDPNDAGLTAASIGFFTQEEEKLNSVMLKRKRESDSVESESSSANERKRNTSQSRASSSEGLATLATTNGIASEKRSTTAQHLLLAFLDSIGKPNCTKLLRPSFLSACPPASDADALPEAAQDSSAAPAQDDILREFIPASATRNATIDALSNEASSSTPSTGATALSSFCLPDEQSGGLFASSYEPLRSFDFTNFAIQQEDGTVLETTPSESPKVCNFDWAIPRQAHRQEIIFKQSGEEMQTVAVEVVKMLAQLCEQSQWRRLLKELVQEVLLTLPDLTTHLEEAARTGEQLDGAVIHQVWRVFGALSIVGGYKCGLHMGCKVSRPSEREEPTMIGTVVEIAPEVRISWLHPTTGEKTLATCALPDELTILTQLPSVVQVEATTEILQALERAILVDTLPSDDGDIIKRQATYLRNQLRSYATKTLGAVVISSEPSNFAVAKRSKALLQQLLKILLECADDYKEELHLTEQRLYIANSVIADMARRDTYESLMPFAPWRNSRFQVPVGWRKATNKLPFKDKAPKFVMSVQHRTVIKDKSDTAVVDVDKEETDLKEMQEGSVYAKYRIPKELPGFYFEMLVRKEGKDYQQMEIGIAQVEELEYTDGDEETKKSECITRFWTYRGSGFKCVAAPVVLPTDPASKPTLQTRMKLSKEIYALPFRAGDVVGCGWDANDSSIFFTRDGKPMGKLRLPVQGNLRPLVRVRSRGALVATNFGHAPFLYNAAHFFSACLAQRDCQSAASLLWEDVAEAEAFLRFRGEKVECENLGNKVSREMTIREPAASTVDEVFDIKTLSTLIVSEVTKVESFDVQAKLSFCRYQSPLGWEATFWYPTQHLQDRARSRARTLWFQYSQALAREHALLSQYVHRVVLQLLSCMPLDEGLALEDFSGVQALARFIALTASRFFDSSLQELCSARATVDSSFCRPVMSLLANKVGRLLSSSSSAKYNESDAKLSNQAAEPPTKRLRPASATENVEEAEAKEGEPKSKSEEQLGLADQMLANCLKSPDVKLIKWTLKTLLLSSDSSDVKLLNKLLEHAQEVLVLSDDEGLRDHNDAERRIAIVEVLIGALHNASQRSGLGIDGQALFKSLRGHLRDLDSVNMEGMLKTNVDYADVNDTDDFHLHVFNKLLVELWLLLGKVLPAQPLADGETDIAVDSILLKSKTEPVSLYEAPLHEKTNEDELEFGRQLLPYLLALQDIVEFLTTGNLKSGTLLCEAWFELYRYTMKSNAMMPGDASGFRIHYEGAEAVEVYFPAQPSIADEDVFQFMNGTDPDCLSSSTSCNGEQIKEHAKTFNVYGEAFCFQYKPGEEEKEQNEESEDAVKEQKEKTNYVFFMAPRYPQTKKLSILETHIADLRAFVAEMGLNIPANILAMPPQEKQEEKEKEKGTTEATGNGDDATINANATIKPATDTGVVEPTPMDTVNESDSSKTRREAKGKEKMTDEDEHTMNVQENHVVVDQASQAEEWSHQQHILEQLAQYVNFTCEKQGVCFTNLPALSINIGESEALHYPLLHPNHVSPLKLRFYFCVLKIFNVLFSRVWQVFDFRAPSPENDGAKGSSDHLPSISTEVRGMGRWPLVQKVQMLRGMIFTEGKAKFLEEVQGHMSHRNPGDKKLKLRRRPKSGKPAGMEETVFYQSYQGTKDIDPRRLRASSNDTRPWHVAFRGEGAQDAGGPFRDALTDMCAELQAEDNRLPLLIPCPNAQLSMESIGIGINRSAYIPRSSSKTPQQLEMFEFLGKLMGIAFLCRAPLTLTLASTVWKPLVGEPLDTSDLKGIDHYCWQALAQLRDVNKNSISEEAFSQSINIEKFTTILSDGTEVALKPNGENIQVTFANRLEYAQLVELARLRESEKQTAAVRKGVGVVLPLGLLNLFTWREFEEMICGKPEIDIKLLRQHTRLSYEWTDSNPTIGYLWEVLEEMDQRERNLFLRFISGRERLPTNIDTNSTNLMTVNKNSSYRNGLPKASTCFSTLYLPEYDSKEELRKMLLLAVTSCYDIDTDFRVRNDNDYYDGSEEEDNNE